MTPRKQFRNEIEHQIYLGQKLRDEAMSDEEREEIIKVLERYESMLEQFDDVTNSV